MASRLWVLVLCCQEGRGHSLAGRVWVMEEQRLTPSRRHLPLAAEYISGKYSSRGSPSLHRGHSLTSTRRRFELSNFLTRQAEGEKEGRQGGKGGRRPSP